MDVTRAFIPLLRRSAVSAERNSMGIINVTSGGGHWSLPHSSLYSASKFGAEGFTEGLSYELASQNLAVKIVVPHGGITETAFATRMSQEIPHGSAEVEKAYDEFNKKIAVVYGRMISGSATPAADVAQTIFEGATDGTDRLRYFINKDAEGFLDIRYGDKGERAAEEYITAMRKYFG
jgi:short-subunit dehydrogenase